MAQDDWGYDSDKNSEKDAEPSTPSILALMDDFAKAVEIFTGFKQQFLDAGWDETNAEAMVIHFMKNSQPKG